MRQDGFELRVSLGVGSVERPAHFLVQSFRHAFEQALLVRHDVVDERAKKPVNRRVAFCVALGERQSLQLGQRVGQRVFETSGLEPQDRSQEAGGHGRRGHLGDHLEGAAGRVGQQVPAQLERGGDVALVLARQLVAVFLGELAESLDFADPTHLDQDCGRVEVLALVEEGAGQLKRQREPAERLE